MVIRGRNAWPAHIGPHLNILLEMEGNIDIVMDSILLTMPFLREKSNTLLSRRGIAPKEKGSTTFQCNKEFEKRATGPAFNGG